MAVSRLYKDGLYSAYVTAGALADCVLEHGVDHESLSEHYGPVIRMFDTDNRYGRAIFFLSRWVFGSPVMSRVLYQALITEVMTKPEGQTDAWQGTLADRQRRCELSQHPGRACSVPPPYGSSSPAACWPLSGTRPRRRSSDWTGPGSVASRPVSRWRRWDASVRKLFSLSGMTPPPRPPQVERMFSIQIQRRARTR